MYILNFSYAKPAGFEFFLKTTTDTDAIVGSNTALLNAPLWKTSASGECQKGLKKCTGVNRRNMNGARYANTKGGLEIKHTSSCFGMCNLFKTKCRRSFL